MVIIITNTRGLTVITYIIITIILVIQHDDTKNNEDESRYHIIKKIMTEIETIIMFILWCLFSVRASLPRHQRGGARGRGASGFAGLTDRLLTTPVPGQQAVTFNLQPTLCLATRSP